MQGLSRPLTMDGWHAASLSLSLSLSRCFSLPCSGSLCFKHIHARGQGAVRLPLWMLPLRCERHTPRLCKHEELSSLLFEDTATFS